MIPRVVPHHIENPKTIYKPHELVKLTDLQRTQTLSLWLRPVEGQKTLWTAGCEPNLVPTGVGSSLCWIWFLGQTPVFRSAGGSTLLVGRSLCWLVFDPRFVRFHPRSPCVLIVIRCLPALFSLDLRQETPRYSKARILVLLPFSEIGLSK